MYYRSSLLQLLLLTASAASAQTVDYSNVGVIINQNSFDSQTIGAYFVAARNIPTVNVIEVDVPISEQITPQQFADLRGQVEQYLLDNDLVDQLDYLVTTKGVPLRSGSTACNTLSNFSGCKSVDSQLCLILGPLAGSIGTNQTVNNPFLASLENHSRAATGVYLVTRLDGFKIDDVTTLIDRSGPFIPVVKQNALIVADLNWTGDPAAVPTFVAQFESITGPLEQDGWNTLTDTSMNMVTGLDDVFGYISIHDAPVLSVPQFNWMQGGIAMEWWSFAAYSFNPSESDPQKRRIAERIAEGVTGARGNVTVAFASPNSMAYHTWVRYTDTSYHFNLAESFYAGIMSLNDSYVVIGDPKTSIVLSSSTAVGEMTNGEALSAFPNPSSGIFTLQAGVGFRVERITDMLGREIPFSSSGSSGSKTIDMISAPDGIYLVTSSSPTGERYTTRVALQR